MFKKIVIVSFVAVLLLGCSKVKTDLENSASALKEDVQTTTAEIKKGIDETKEFVDDIKNAATKVDEAKDALKQIGD